MRYLALVSILTVIQTTAGEMYTHSETGIEFPKAIGSYQLGEAKPYKGAPGEAGVAISYHAVSGAWTRGPGRRPLIWSRRVSPP